MKRFILTTFIFAIFFFIASNFIYPILPFAVNRWIADPILALVVYLTFFRKNIKAHRTFM
ncbi:hypothetical protein ACWIWA_10200 [Ursidibacter arcticus]